MKVISDSDIFIQCIPCPARVPVEVEDTYAASLISDKIVRAATPEEIAAHPDVSEVAIARDTLDRAASENA